MTTVTIECTPDQAAALTRMLDLSVRIHMCQFWEIEMLARFESIKHVEGRPLTLDERDELRLRLARVSEVFGFSPSASFGVGSPHVDSDAHRGYELKKVLEKAIAEWREPNPQGIRGVNYDGLIVRYTDDQASVVRVEG